MNTSRPGRPPGTNPNPAPRCIRPSAELQQRIQKLLRFRSAERLAVELRSSVGVIEKIADRMPVKPGTAERIEAILDAREANECVDCGHAATSHAVDDEERRECLICKCAQYRCAVPFSADLAVGIEEVLP